MDVKNCQEEMLSGLAETTLARLMRKVLRFRWFTEGSVEILEMNGEGVLGVGW